MTSLNPLHRVGRQVAESLLVHRGMGKAEARERVLELLKMVGIADPAAKIDSFPHELSGGQRLEQAVGARVVGRAELLEGVRNNFV